MKQLWLILLLLTGTVLVGQNNVVVGNTVINNGCDEIVNDTAHVFGDTTDIVRASEDLRSVGADVRVVSLMSANNLDQSLNGMMVTCPSWQDASGKNWKSTMVVLALSMNRKKGVHYGSAWHKALDDHWARILEETMTPRFRSGDFSGGMIAAEHQLASRIKASQSEAITPVSNTTVEQPTDYSGLWVVMKWTLFLIFFGLVGTGVMVWWSKRKRERREIDDEQRRAMEERNTTARALTEARRDLDVYADAVGLPIAKKAYDLASEAYSKLGGELRNDPTQDGMSAIDYKLIGENYRSVRTRLNAGMEFLRRPLRNNAGTVTEETPKPPSPPSPPPPPKEEPPVVREEVVTRETPSSNNVFAPVVIGNTFGSSEDREEREERREARRREREDDSSSSSRSSSWSSSGSSGGGGSSDWGGSDSGGGGSSDFGGGGDSGGGGSSSW